MKEELMLDKLKKNVTVFGELSGLEQKYLKKIYNGKGCDNGSNIQIRGDDWCNVYPSWNKGRTFRINPEWNPEPESKYVEYDIDDSGDVYTFNLLSNKSTLRTTCLHEVFGSIGFAGIAFKELKGWYMCLKYSDGSIWNTDEDILPATPIKVKFNKP